MEKHESQKRTKKKRHESHYGTVKLSAQPFVHQKQI